MPEQTNFTTELARLAPEVDETAGRELFERRRREPSPRWLMPAAAVMLVVAGVVGLIIITGDEADAPANPVDTTVADDLDAALRPAPGETLIVGEEHFDVITVEQTTVGFGNAELVLSEDGLASLWAEWNPGVDQPAVDFAGNAALVMTRPDNACADVVTRFEVTNQNDGAVWTPVFEELADACNDPLLSWLYVVAIDRVALGDQALIRIPAAEVYGVPEQILEYTAPAVAPDQSADPAPVTLTATDVVVPLPPVGEPALHNTGAGMFYVVRHDSGDVSVLPATIDRRTTEDEGVTMLRSFVVASESGGSFYGDGDIWDAWGRAATAGRSADLVGYAGQVVGDEVEVLYSDATRVEGDPEVPNDEDYPLPPRPSFEAITPEQFVTLSSSGPAWRLFDAQLVVEDGVGRICRVDTNVAFDQFDGCDETGVVIDTLVTSTNPDITTWYESPVLAFQDPVRGFTNVIPLAGYSSRNDALLEQPDDSVVTSIEITCGGLDGSRLLARVGLDLPGDSQRTLSIVDGDRELGGASTSGSGPVTVGFALDSPPTESAELIVTAGNDEIARVPVPHDGLTSCPTGVAELSEPVPHLLAIGDSVMLGARSELARQEYTVVGAITRQFADVIPTVEQLVDAGFVDDVPTVFHLGTNGPIESTDLDDLLDAFADEQSVFLLTIHADRPWTEPNNELIRQAGDRSNVTVVDWAEMAELCPGDCFAEDDIHLAEAGRTYYADLIADATGR